MRREVRLLVTACGSRTVTQPLIDCMRRSDRFACEFWGVDIQPNLICPDLSYRCVLSEDKSFLRSVDEICQSYSIEAVLPLIEEDLIRLKSAPSLGPRTVGPPLTLATLLSDKGKLLEALQSIAPTLAPPFVAVDRIDDIPAAARDLGYPKRDLILKPRRSRGTRGAVRLSSAPIEITQQGGLPQYTPEFLAAHLNPDTFAASIAMPFLSGRDLSAYALCADGALTAFACIERESTAAGITWSGRVLREPVIERYVEDLGAALGISGFFNVQLRFDGARALLYEINPRLSGSTAIAALAGVNFPELILLHHFGHPVPRQRVGRALDFRRVVHTLWRD